MSELQAAVLLPQLAKLDDRNARRAAGVEALLERLQAYPGLAAFQNRTAETRPSYYKLGFRYDPERFDGLSRERFISAARAEGIALDEGFRASHVGRAASRFRRGGDLVEATKADAGVVVLHHPVLLGGPAEIGQVAAAVEKLHAHARALHAGG
jgi:perosamine synthetase